MLCGLSSACVPSPWVPSPCVPAGGTSTVGLEESVVTLARPRPLPARPNVGPLRNKRLLALPDLLAAFARPLAEEPLAAADSARFRPPDFPWASKAGVVAAER